MPSQMPAARRLARLALRRRLQPRAHRAPPDRGLGVAARGLVAALPRDPRVPRGGDRALGVRARRVFQGVAFQAPRSQRRSGHARRRLRRLARRPRPVPVAAVAEPGEFVHRFVHRAVGGQGGFDLGVLLDQV